MRIIHMDWRSVTMTVGAKCEAASAKFKPQHTRAERGRRGGERRGTAVCSQPASNAEPAPPITQANAIANAKECELCRSDQTTQQKEKEETKR
jgi:hypothetical protein